MSIRTDLSVNWEVSPRIITVAAPSTSITIQDLHDTCRDIEDNLPESMEFDKLIDSAGKEPLGGGSYVGITATLQNAKLAFEARPPSTFVSCTVTGGNLVAVDASGNNMDPIQVTDYTQVTISQSSSPTIIQAPTDYATLYMLEGLRGQNSSIGSVWYWNPKPGAGSDSNDGTTPANAVATFAHAQGLASAGAGDVVFALCTDSSGVITTSEQITISTAGLKLRGPGHSFQFTPSTDGSPTIDITADNVEVSGFYVTTAAGGPDNGITVTGDAAYIKDCWIQGATGNGIDISSSARSTVETCAIENCKGNGINMGDYTTLSTVRQCIITGSGTVGTPTDGAYLTGSNTSDNIFENNVIYNNTSYGINIDTYVTRTGVRLHNTFSGNSAGSTNNLGTATFIDTGGAVTGDDITNIVHGVWNEVISTGYTTTGSAAKILKDTKTKATLASLK